MARIDINKKYTCNGYPVMGIVIEEFNSCGDLVTYPVKGTVMISQRKRRYMIWSIEGQNDVVWNKNPNWDLVEVE